MAIKTDREYRNVELRDFELKDENYIVEGYATTFDDPYLLVELDGVKYYEQISRDAFDEADMSDVIFLYDHEGMVFARLSNNTLTLELDEKGLKVRADLSSTTQSREMFEDFPCISLFAWEILPPNAAQIDWWPKQTPRIGILS